MTAQAFKIPQHLKPGHTQAAGLDCGDCRAPALGVTHQIARRQHDLAESGAADRGELGLQRPGQRDGVHPEIVEIAFDLAHGGSARRAVAHVVYQLETHAAHHRA